MKIVNENNWKTVGNITLEKNALDAIKCEKNTLVIAGPGAGKTELLAQKACYLFETNLCRAPQKILAISFKKDSAENLKERVLKRYGEEIKDRFISLTYDAFFKSIVDHFIYSLPVNCRPNINYVIADDNMINEAFKKAANKDISLDRSIIKNKNKKINSVTLPLDENSLEGKVWNYLLKGFDNNEAAITFSMITKLATYIVDTNPMIKRAIQATYSYVFLDEFQDTTELQYLFLKSCFKDSKSIITAVGDYKQRIMVWAGALKTVFDDFRSDFNADDFNLIMNYRSAPRLVSLQKAMYGILNESQSYVGTSDKWNDDDGCVKLLMSKNELQESQNVVESIKENISDGMDLKDICILCKQKIKDYTSQIIIDLQKEGIRARDEGEYQEQLSEPIVNLILNFLKLSVNRKSPDEWINLETEYIAIMDETDENQDDIYRDCIYKLDCKLKEINKYLKLPLDINKFNYMIDNIIDFFNIDRIKARYITYKQGDYFNKTITKFKDLFWKEYEYAELNMIKAIEGFRGLYSIPIMTIHKSKGLEYSAVYFIGLEDDAFWNYNNQQEEDRCAFFVAISRAKKFLMFTFCEQRKNTKNPIQKTEKIEEFYDLLSESKVAEKIDKRDCV
jgi:superfamily I DNA/RNA helicase